MSANSSIEWTEATWNPVRGCTKVSPGCKHCYAETFAERFRGVKGHPYEQGFDVRLVPEALDLPLRWKKPRRVFVNSMSDLFHEDVPEAFIGAVFTVMASSPQHTFQVLTKRAERMRDVVSRIRWHVGMAFPSWAPRQILTRLASLSPDDWRAIEDGRPAQPQQPPPWAVPPNVWLGVSVENQAAADERIPHLLATPAAVRFLSCEPLLGEVSLRRWFFAGHHPSWDGHPDRARIERLHWIIIGGESGHGARACDVAWIRRVVQQCRAAHVPCFTKQLGAHVEDRNDAGFDGDTPTSWPMDTDVQHDESDTGYQGAPVRVRLVDRKGGDPAEWPADLRVREMPKETR